MRLRIILLACGITSSVLYVTAIDVYAPIAHPEYHSYRYQMVSELFAAEAPTREILGLPMMLYNALVLAFAMGVWKSAARRRTMRLMAVALGTYGIISATAFFVAPMDVRGSGGITERDMWHILATALQGIALVSALVLGGFVLGRGFRAYSYTTLGICVVFGTLASLSAAQEVSAWLGTTERVSIYAWMVWVAVLAVVLLRSADLGLGGRGRPNRLVSPS
jgi:hypothetical protein